MKRLLTILSIMIVVLSANAHQRICPMCVCDKNTYAEVIKIIDIMEKTSFIEQMEGIRYNNGVISTYGGEFILQKESNSIMIMHDEFTEMLNDYLMNPHRRHYDINTIRTELCIQNVKLFEYISDRLYGNRNIKNIYINTITRTGATYIQIDYYRL